MPATLDLYRGVEGWRGINTEMVEFITKRRGDGTLCLLSLHLYYCLDGPLTELGRGGGVNSTDTDTDTVFTKADIDIDTSTWIDWKDGQTDTNTDTQTNPQT